ncbi:MAG: hypothetical protein V1884_03575 [Candidatus Omnitrophota bacterium]
MYFYLIGIDYKTAPLGPREHFYCQRPAIIDFWKTKEAALLFTCSRIEIYIATQDTDTAFGYLREFSKAYPDLFKYAYVKYGEKEVFRHALRLASGLESQLEGELQIFQQLDHWHRHGYLPFALDGLWGNALSLARDIRAQSGLNDDGNNIAGVVYADLSKRFKSVQTFEIIVVGTGKIAGLLARYRQGRIRLNFVAHKNYEKAKELAGIAQGRVFLLKDLPELLLKTDALISATSSPHYVLKRKDFLNMRHPFYIYDLALPRDVEPAVRELPGIFLQNLDDLTEAIHQFNQGNQENIHFTNRLVAAAIEGHPEAAYAKNY